MILTDANGRPFDKPDQNDYESHKDYLQALWSYKDQVADCANRAFDRAFRSAMKSKKAFSE